MGDFVGLRLVFFVIIIITVSEGLCNERRVLSLKERKYMHLHICPPWINKVNRFSLKMKLVLMHPL